jgi:hypothetical protein
VRTRKSTRAEAIAEDDELACWLHALTDGESTARRYRQRLRAEGPPPEDASTDRDASDDHRHGRQRA